MWTEGKGESDNSDRGGDFPSDRIRSCVCVSLLNAVRSEPVCPQARRGGDQCRKGEERSFYSQAATKRLAHHVCVSLS